MLGHSSLSASRGYEEFFEGNYARVVRALTYAFRDQALAEDCAQEAFANAFARWRDVSNCDRPDAWVYVVALRAGRRHIGRHIEQPAAEPVDGFEAGVVATADMTARLRLLTPRQRVVVVLRYYADLTTPEIASALGLAEGTVRATLHQCLLKLRVAEPVEEEAPCL